MKKCLLTLIVMCFTMNGLVLAQDSGPNLFPAKFPNGKWGYIDNKGNVKIEGKFNRAYEFSEGLACVRENEKYGFIDKVGDFIIDTMYRIGGEFSSGVAIVENSNREWLLIDKKNNSIKNFGYEERRSLYSYHLPFANGLYPIRMKGKYGYIDITGEWKIKPQFDRGGHFENGLAWINQFHADGSGYQIDVNGNRVSEDKIKEMKNSKTKLSPVFSLQTNFSDGLAIVSMRIKTSRRQIGFEFSGKVFGIINTDGQLLNILDIGFIDNFDEDGFSEGLIAFEAFDDFWGFINHKGKIKIGPGFYRVKPFKNGIAKAEIKVNKERKTGYINKKGEWVWGPY